jgi:tetratricopeptide (TPR) repeat protein
VRADTILLKTGEKLDKVTIKSENAKTVVISHTAEKKKKEETIPSVNISDVVYEDIRPFDLRSGAYKNATDAEKDVDSEDSAKKKKALDAAIAGYTQTVKEMKRDSQSQKNAARHLEFKLAVLILKSGADELTILRGVERLQQFAKDHRDSWQINQVLPMLAQIQMDNKDWKEAAKTYQDMAAMKEFSPEVRRDAKLMLVTIAVRAKDMELANKRLQELKPEAESNPAFGLRVDITRADILMGQKQTKEAIELLQKVVNSKGDKATMAQAHNMLGECLFKSEKFAEARWEFLYVDTVYNQDKHQHAKALYYLWKIFGEVKTRDEARAKQCRAMLEEPQFNGTEYQKLARQGK